MKLLFAVLISLTINPLIFAQQEWQEFLSHDRSVISNNGHLLINDTLHIAYNDGVKKITENKKAEILFSHYAHMYQTKVTRTGIHSKELLLLHAFDYDIAGTGLVSIRNVDGELWAKEQFGYEDFDFDFQSVPDGIISPSPQILDQVIDHNGDLVKIENGMLITTSPAPIDHFHEGLNDNFFAIKGDTLFSYTDETMNQVLILEDHRFLLNDPYTNSLVIQTDDKLKWYSYSDFSLTHSQVIEPETYPVQFISDGFYKAVITDQNIIVSKNTISDTPDNDTVYTLPLNEIPNFSISSFEVTDHEIYFIGQEFNNGFGFHYVQRRVLDQVFAPNRADLAIDTFSYSKNLASTSNLYDYSFTVRNNGTQPINSFAISSPSLPIFCTDCSYIRKHFDVNLAPGETFSFNGSSNMITNPNQLTIKVIGVNYAFDGNNDNDSYTADVKSLSSTNLTKLNLNLSPNPSSDILSINGDIDNQSEIHIYDLNGKPVKYNRLTINKLDISRLPVGLYNLVVSNKTLIQSITFTKL